MCLIVLPCPRVLLGIACDSVSVISALLLLAGDVELNPGPMSAADKKQFEEMYALLQKLDLNFTRFESGQDSIKSDIRTLLERQTELDGAISALSARVVTIENEVSSLSQTRTDIGRLKNDLADQSAATSCLLSRVDEMENQSRRSNLLFYGIPDIGSESWEVSEQNILNFAKDKLGVTIVGSDIERAHRLGTFRPGRTRPIIAKFSSFKTKNKLLLSGHKLKGTSSSLSEDFSITVRAARKSLLDFAKTQTNPFKLRFDKLSIGAKTYAYDRQSKTVVELPR